MAGPSAEDFEQRKKAWAELCARFNRALGADPQVQRLGEAKLVSGSPIGEARLELEEFIAQSRASEVARWEDLCKRYPHALSIVDPGEIIPFEQNQIDLWHRFLKERKDWLEVQMSGRQQEYWEEFCSPGVYWLRFQRIDDLEAFTKHFSIALQKLACSNC